MAKKDDKPDLGAQIADIRKKKEMAFAMQIGKDGLVFVTDLKTKSYEKLWRDGKNSGGSAKGAKGLVRIKGKTLELRCDDVESVPGNLVKVAKKHFADNKQSLKIVLSSMNESDEGADADEEEDDAVEERARADQEQEETAVEEETVAAVEEATDESVAEQLEDAEGENPDEALRNVLRKEYDDLAEDLAQAQQSTNAGAVKKVEALKDMFAKQIDGDVKKTASVMTLLKATVQDAIKAGVAGGASGAEGDDKPTIDPAVLAARKSKMEELEKGVDALLAEFA